MISYRAPAVTRAMMILEYLAWHEEASFTEIHTSLDLPKSSTYGILAILEEGGYIQRSVEKDVYTLGLKLVELGSLAASRINIRREAKPFLEQLMKLTRFTANLSILDGLHMVYIDKIEPQSFIKLNSWIGKRQDLHCTAIGKVLLAYQPEKKMEDILGRMGFKRHTDSTITDKEKLKVHLWAVRQQGYALDDQENEHDIRCVAVPVFGSEGMIVAAISLSGLASQINDSKVTELVDILKENVNKLSQVMGYNVPQKYY